MTRRLTVSLTALAALLTGPAAVAAPPPDVGLTPTLISPPAWPDKVDSKVEPLAPRFLFRAGESRAYRSTVDQKLKLGDGDVVSTTIETDYTDAVKAITPGSGQALVERKTQTVDVSMSQGDVTLAQKQTKAIAAKLKRIEQTLRLSPRGEHHGVAVKHRSLEVKVLTDALDVAAVGLTPEFPEEPVAVGQGWRQTYQHHTRQGPVDLDMTFLVDFTLRGVVPYRGHFAAVFEVDVTMTLAKTEARVMSHTATVEGSGTGRGVLVFDHEVGHVAWGEVALARQVIIRGEGAPPLEMLIETASRIEAK